MQRAYVLEPGAYLRKNGDNLTLFRDGKPDGEIPLEGLQQLTLIGYTSLSGAVLDVLIRRRVETVLLSPSGRFRARLMVDEHKHVERRRAQYLRLSDHGTVLDTARALIRGKLLNSARFLALRGHQLDEPELKNCSVRIRAMADAVEGLRELDLLRGAEGHAANIYFEAFPRLIRASGFTFNGRNRRPPLDPVNALLSFVYTLLTQEVLTSIKTVGLDPYLGALHAVDYGRPSLACDLVEEWRAFLGDRLVLTLINRQAIRPDDFVFRDVRAVDHVDEPDLKRRRPVEMKPAVVRAFMSAYEKWMNARIVWPETGEKVAYRGLIQRQARQFSRFLLGECEGYAPFAWSRVN